MFIKKHHNFWRENTIEIWFSHHKREKDPTFYEISTFVLANHHYESAWGMLDLEVKSFGNSVMNLGMNDVTSNWFSNILFRYLFVAVRFHASGWVPVMENL